MQEKNLLPKIYGTGLIKSLCEVEFEGDMGMGALVKSQTFYFELFELFSHFNKNGLVSKRLFEALYEAEDKINLQDKKRLELIFAVYKKFMEKIEAFGYEMPVFEHSSSVIPKNLNLWANGLLNSFENKNYIEFDDMQNEIVFIASEIKKATKNGENSLCDFGIFASNDTLKRSYIQLFNALGVKTNYGVLNESVIQFRIKLEQFFNVAEILYSFGVKKIEENELVKISANYEKKYDEIMLFLNNLNLTIIELSHIYEFYFKGEYTEIILYFAKQEKVDVEKINKKIAALLNFYTNVIKKQVEFQAVLGILDGALYNIQNEEKNVVTIFSNTNNIKNKTFKSLYVPSLIETTFVNNECIYFICQKTNDVISAEIKKIAPKFEKIVPDKGGSLNFKMLESVLEKCSSNLTFSTFNYAQSKQIQPSVFFELFKNNDLENFRTYKKEELNNNIDVPNDIKPELEKNSPIISKNEVLHLNPSAISNFQSCPKKYFFKNLLKLKEQSDFSASYGTIAHSILELFNRNYLKKYNKCEILKICDTLFLAKIFPENALELGFGEVDVELVKSTDDLSLAQMRDKFYDAVDNLFENGFFNNPPSAAYCEVKFEFELNEIENVIFDGRIDCIMKKNEAFEVVDYKTGKNKKKPLEYYASDWGVSFCGDYGANAGKFNEKLVDEYEYQIPIYYLGIKNASSLVQFKSGIEHFTLEYIRPKSVEDGYKKDSVSALKLKNVEEKIIQNLNEKIVDKIRTEKEFLPKPELYKCLNCSYSFLCDGIDFEDIADD